jgi:hypothetical protein
MAVSGAMRDNSNNNFQWNSAQEYYYLITADNVSHWEWDFKSTGQ